MAENEDAEEGVEDCEPLAAGRGGCEGPVSDGRHQSEAEEHGALEPPVVVIALALEHVLEGEASDT